MLPKFLLIGGIKCGSTSAHTILNQHPRLQEGKTKEIDFFNKESNWEKGINWYKKQFKPSGKEINFESTPVYFTHPWALSRIHNHIPEVKMMIILRNPIDRAWSQYKHQNGSRQRDSFSFSENIRNQSKYFFPEYQKLLIDPKHNIGLFNHAGLLYRGHYEFHLRRVFDLFSKKNVAIFEFEDFFQNTQERLDAVCDFLEIDRYTFNTNIKLKATSHIGHPWRSRGGKKDMDQKDRDYLTEYFSSHNERLFDLLGVEFDWT